MARVLGGAGSFSQRARGEWGNGRQDARCDNCSIGKVKDRGPGQWGNLF